MITTISNYYLLITNYLITHSPFLYLVQSLWRDEAFSVVLAEHNFLDIVRLTANDYNPPLYYLLLHFWMKIFGQSEISVRMLSFLFHILLTYIAYLFVKKFLKSKFFIFNFSFLIFFNPMLLYYAFEARMYSLLALLATLSMYHFYQKNWLWHIVFTTLGLYTQPFMIFVLLTQLIYLILTSDLKGKIIKLITPLILYSPWILIIFNQFKQSSQSWIHPADFRLVISSLGNLFLGFNGHPSFLWNFTKILSLIILFFSLKVIHFARKKNPPALLFFFWVFLPLSLTLLISFFKPIYVNRYLIFITVGEIFLITLGIEKIANKIFRKIFIFCFLFFVFCFNFWFAPFHKKRDFRKTMMEINQLATPKDIILVNSAISFFETIYYAEDRSICFIFNQRGISIPSYIGKAIIPQDKILTKLPSYPNRAFLIYKDASFEIVYKK